MLVDIATGHMYTSHSTAEQTEGKANEIDRPSRFLEGPGGNDGSDDKFAKGSKIQWKVNIGLLQFIQYTRNTK